MTSLIEKTKKQIQQLAEESITPTFKNTSGKKLNANDEKDLSNESSNIFSMFNFASDLRSLKVDVTIDEDVEEETSNSISEDGKDTVYGQGTNPKPEDETYLNLLKNSTPKPKVKIKL